MHERNHGLSLHIKRAQLQHQHYTYVRNHLETGVSMMFLKLVGDEYAGSTQQETAAKPRGLYGAQNTCKTFQAECRLDYLASAGHGECNGMRLDTGRPGDH